jgi:tetratricopeptide (TPR) repeat protein
VDLPAPKPGGRTMAGGFANAKPARGTDGALLGDLDRSAPTGFADLPAPKGFADLPAAKGGNEPSFGDPLAPSAPPLQGLADLPAPKGAIDLPAPKGIADLPTPKGAVDLPMPKGTVDLPAPRGIADLPTAKGVTDLPKLGGASFGELDLPVPKAGADEEASFGDLELPDLPVRAGFGNIELPAPRANADLVPPKAATFQGVGPFGGSDESNFGDLDLGGPEASFADIQPDDLVALKEQSHTSTPPALQEEGGEDFGEAGLLSEEGEEDMEFGIAGQGDAEEENLGLPPELLRRNKGEVEQAEDAARGKRALHVLIGVAAVLVVLGGAGAALGMTDYGYFGVYFLERYLPEAGDARFARDAIERAEKTAATDTYRDVQKSLSLLGESRHKAGLNRELLTRSLVHEALFLVRFGPNPTSSAHVAAIMARLEERHGDAPGMDLARAADAARKQAWADAERSLTAAREQNPNDAYVGLLAGEVALHQGKLAEAEKAFSEALKHGGSARAQWGLARVALARTDVKAQRSAVEATLKASPLHAEARLADARLAWNAGEQDRALTELRQALGQEKIGDQLLRPSKPAKAEGYSLLGFIEESRGHLSGARKAYEDALSADPYLVEALLGAGRVLLRERRWNDALARFESALNLAQKSGGSIVLSGRRADVEARLGQGRALLALNRLQDAKATLSQLLKDNPNDPEIVRAAGQTEDALGNKATAEEMLSKAVELAPTTFASYLALAQHYFKENRADKASETLNEASTKVEENVEMRRMLGQSELARNRFDSAVHEFKRAVELDPQDLESQFGLGVGLRKQGQLAQAREIFEHIAQKDPQFAGLALERGELLEAEGKFDEAVATYKAARDKDPSDASIALRLGAAQVEAGKLDDADLTLQGVMRQMPNSAEAEYFTGRLALARGRGPDALTHFDRALSLDNSQALYHLYAARAALEMSNLGRTLEEAEGALERDGSLGDAYWIRGVVRMRSGAVKDALKDAKRALELNPSRYDAYALMAECYDELRQLPDAVNAYHMALEKDPQRGEWEYKLGRLSLDMGARGEAEIALNKAIALGDKMDPMPYWLPDAYRLTGELARSQNNRKLAVTLFKRYLKIAPDGALDRDDVRKLLKSWDVDLNED